MISGRSYRIQSISDKFLYSMYVSRCGTHRTPIGKTYFFESILNKLNVRKCLIKAFCPTCIRLRELENIEQKSEIDQRWYDKNKDHKENSKKQKLEYLKMKAQLSTGEIPDTVIVIQDFTQIQTADSLMQDFIVTIYRVDDDDDKKFYHLFEHFVSRSSKNDYTFVVACWFKLFDKGLFTGIKKIIIWSDGGGKHFKISVTLDFFHFLQSPFLKLDLNIISL